MTWTARTSTGAATGSSASNVTANVPASTVNGELLFAITRSGSGAMIDDSGNWTQISSTTSGGTFVQTWYKIAASEPASYTFHASGGITTHFLAIQTFGAPSAGTISVDVHAEAANASNVSICAPGVTVSNADSLAVWSGWIGGGGADVTPPTGYTEDQDLVSTHRVELSHLLSIGTGATGDVVATGAAANSNIGTITIFTVSTAVAGQPQAMIVWVG
jgi:hypothetical protein